MAATITTGDRTMAAVWYRPDNVGPEFFFSEPYRDLDALAAQRRVLVKVDRSNITRGWTYNSNIYLIQPTGTFHADAPHIERNRYVPHGAGSGLNPLTALIDAMRLTHLDREPLVAVAILQAELWLLARAYRLAREREERSARIFGKLDAAMADLTELVRSYTVPPAAPQPIPAKPDEDDDL